MGIKHTYDCRLSDKEIDKERIKFDKLGYILTTINNLRDITTLTFNNKLVVDMNNKKIPKYQKRMCNASY